jgi:outer membrane protein OmpA-like peptidoglycan-associated protein
MATTTSLLESLSAYITPNVISNASSLLGESPGNTQKALTGILPTLLAGASSLGSSTGGASRLMTMLQSGGFDGSILNNLPALLSNKTQTESLVGSGKELLGTLLGDKGPAVANAVANYSSITPSSASSLLALGAPMVMSMLGKIQVSQGLGASGLASLLTSQKSGLMAAIPAGLASMPGISSLFGSAGAAVSPAATAVATGARGANKLLLPLVLLVVIALGLLAYWKGCGSTVQEHLAKITLPGGQVLTLREGSLNYNLAQFLANGNNSELPKNFVFDNLNFNTGTTQLTPESVPTVNDLIVILKAYPGAEIQLVGHTDNTGDPAANTKLSQDRAVAVRDMLVNGSIDGSRITTAGYGQDKPIASNDTEEGRAKNRRTELVVTKK